MEYALWLSKGRDLQGMRVLLMDEFLGPPLMDELIFRIEIRTIKLTEDENKKRSLYGKGTNRKLQTPLHGYLI